MTDPAGDAPGRLEESQRRNIELEAANAVLETFSRDIAHELRNPLTILFGYSRALLELQGEALEANTRKFAEKISGAVRRMALIIDDLENLSTISRSEPRSVSADLSAMAQEVADRLKEGEPERRVEFRIAAGIVAWGDSGLLRLMLGNLLKNAWKYTAKTESALIEFGAAHREGRLAYYVRDNGAGFDMAEVDKLFHPFARLHGLGEFAGTGIGLTIVSRVVARHQGRVWADGKVGEGATFWFTLPVR